MIIFFGYARAEEHFTTVVEYDPEGKQMGNIARLFRSMARHQLGRHDEAQADLKAVEKRILLLPLRDELPFTHDAAPVFVSLVYEEAKALLGEGNEATKGAARTQDELKSE